MRVLLVESSRTIFQLLFPLSFFQSSHCLYCASTSIYLLSPLCLSRVFFFFFFFLLMTMSDLLDATVAMLSGVQVGHELAEGGKETPIIMLTARLPSRAACWKASMPGGRRYSRNLSYCPRIYNPDYAPTSCVGVLQGGAKLHWCRSRA